MMRSGGSRAGGRRARGSGLLGRCSPRKKEMPRCHLHYTRRASPRTPAFRRSIPAKGRYSPPLAWSDAPGGDEELRADRRRSRRARSEGAAQADLGPLGALRYPRRRAARWRKAVAPARSPPARIRGSTTGSAPATAARVRRSAGIATSTSSTRSIPFCPISEPRPKPSSSKPCRATCSRARSSSGHTRRGSRSARLRRQSARTPRSPPRRRSRRRGGPWRCRWHRRCLRRGGSCAARRWPRAKSGRASGSRGWRGRSRRWRREDRSE